MGLSIWQMLIILVLLAIPIAAFVMAIVALAKIGSLNTRLSRFEGQARDRD